MSHKIMDELRDPFREYGARSDQGGNVKQYMRFPRHHFIFQTCVKRCIKKDPSICLLSIQNAMKQSLWPFASEIQHWNFYSTSRYFALFGGSLTARCCGFGKEFFHWQVYSLPAVTNLSITCPGAPKGILQTKSDFARNWYNMIHF